MLVNDDKPEGEFQAVTCSVSNRGTF